MVVEPLKVLVLLKYYNTQLINYRANTLCITILMFRTLRA